MNESSVKLLVPFSKDGDNRGYPLVLLLPPPVPYNTFSVCCLPPITGANSLQYVSYRTDIEALLSKHRRHPRVLSRTCQEALSGLCLNCGT